LDKDSRVLQRSLAIPYPPRRKFSPALDEQIELLNAIETVSEALGGSDGEMNLASGSL